MSERAVVLLSGGLDSATTLAIALSEGLEVYAISFDYGQRHAVELAAARRVAASMAVARHLILPMNLRDIGASALTSEQEVPKHLSVDELSSDIPVTYVPARNLVFLSLALAWAEAVGARHLFIGVNALDYSGYPDCRPEFLESFAATANLGTKAGVEGNMFQVHAPLVRMTKAEIIGKGIELGVDYSLTHSCYDPSSRGRPCGRCDSCLLRAKGFQEAGFEDPLLADQGE
ncbi:7-cyano-7-deazaguanine synthase QueC [Thermodesulfobacteriota bacterium]